MPMVALRPLDEVDLVAGGQSHHGLLPVRPAPGEAAHALELALVGRRADGGHLDVEHRLHALHHAQRAVGDARGHRRPQRLAPHLARHRLVVGARRGAEGLAAALPLRGADRALARAAGALLLPRLPAAARDLAAALRVVRARAPIRQLAHHRLVQQRHADLHAEDVGLELHRALALALRVDDLHARHHFFSAFCCCALVVLMLLRTITSEPLAPGTAPRIRIRFCSGSTRATVTLSVVRCTPPMRPGSLWPGHTREGSEEAPMEPGARWNIEPCVASPPRQPWRLTPPWNPLPLVTPTTSTISPGANISTVSAWPTSYGFSTLSSRTSRRMRVGATLAFLKWPARGLETFFFAGSKPSWSAS